ncbi:MAG: ribbon-helix-helix protein, CopG family [Egibacteraceae bacterium]
MRTTVTLDDDVVRAVEQLRRQHGLGLSAAVNALARRGLAHREGQLATFTQRVSSLGPARIPLDDVGAALEVLEGEAHRG